MSHSERVRAQIIQVELSLYFDPRPAANTGRLDLAVDYVRILGDVRFLLEHGEFILIESAAEAICRYLLLPSLPDAPRAELQAVRLKLTKPHCLDGFAIPSLEIYREKKELQLSPIVKNNHKVIPIHGTRDCGIHLIQLYPGKSLSVAGTQKESEMILGTELKLQHETVLPGHVFRWSGNHLRQYQNLSSLPQSILHISHPATLPWQETTDETCPRLGVFAPVPYYLGVMADYMRVPD